MTHAGGRTRWRRRTPTASGPKPVGCAAGCRPLREAGKWDPDDETTAHLIAEAEVEGRVPDEPGDSRAEAWLDPARGLLPVRARFSAADGRDETDFLLSR